MKKPVLAVWVEGDEKNKPKISFEFGEKINNYFLIGILETIKDELLKQIYEASEDEK